jgi:hypothetical protein
MSKQTRQKFGISGDPIPATSVLVKEMDASQFGDKASYALIAINEVEGTFTAANVYGGNLGRNYDPSAYTHDLPSEGEREAWDKTKAKKGYEPGNVEDFDVLVAVAMDEVEETEAEVDDEADVEEEEAEV